MFDENATPLSPINFFQISLDCYSIKENSSFPQLKSIQKKYTLPDTSGLCGDEAFAKIAMGWNSEGIEICVEADTYHPEVRYPEIAQGDSVEIFIDTRDVKTSGFNTRFCHHFFFLPESIEGHMAGELTHFRTEDAHELCDPKLLKVESQVKKNWYLMHIFIPAHCLNGYEPSQFNRMGFSYRINRRHGAPQHFSAVSSEYQINQQPSLWASVRLIP